MSIQSVKEIPGKRASVDREFQRDYTRRFRVICDVPNQSEISILTHPKIPKPWQPHDRDPFSYADVPQVTQEKNKYHWIVEVDYTSDVDTGEKQENPLEWAAEIDWSSQEFQRLAFLDRDGKPILNTAGDPFEGGGLPVEDSFWTINVEKNVPSVPKKLVTENYASSVNQDALQIDGINFPPNTLKAKRITISRRKFHKKLRYRTLVVTYQSKPETWTQEVLNRGYNQLVASFVAQPNSDERTLLNLERQRVLVGSPDGQHGEPPTEPVFLDRQGRYIDKPNRIIRKVKGGTVEKPTPLPTDPEELKAELKKRADVIVLTWDVEKQKTFRGVLPLA